MSGNVQQWLQSLLKQRLIEMRKRNPEISIRAFAKKLSLSPSTVSLVLLGKRSISKKLAQSLADALRLDPMEKARLLQALNQEVKSKSRKSEERSPHQKSQQLEQTHQPSILKLDPQQFEKISEWHYFAILSLVKTVDFSTDPAWIADRLSIHPHIAKEAMSYLVQEGLIVVDASGKAKRGYDFIRTSDLVPEKVIRKHHEQNLFLAQKAMKVREFTQCDFSSINLPVNYSKLQEIRLRIRKFQESILTDYAYDPEANEVIRVAFQVFPMTNPRSIP